MLLPSTAVPASSRLTRTTTLCVCLRLASFVLYLCLFASDVQDRFVKKRLSARQLVNDDVAYFMLVYQNRRSLRLYRAAVETCLRQMAAAGLFQSQQQAHQAQPPPFARLAASKSPTYADAVAVGLVHDYESDIAEAEARFKREPFPSYCYNGMLMLPMDKGGCRGTERTHWKVRCSCPFYQD